MRRSYKVLGAGAAFAGLTAWQRAHPSAFPYSLRWLLAFPQPYLDQRSFESVLEPQRGERMLEIGPGTGRNALGVAEAISPDGILEILDLQQEMLDSVMEKARRRGLTNIRPTRGDATSLPYESASLDAAYMVTVLGEIPDRDACIAELNRVLKPGGRLLFGESVLDPHVVTLGRLREQLGAHGFEHELTRGRSPIGYFARFRKP